MRISIRRSPRAAQAAPSGVSRKGFVIVEVIVAMVILAVAISSLAALVLSVSKSGIKTTGDAYRNGILMQEVNRLEHGSGEQRHLRTYAGSHCHRAHR